MTQYKSRCSCGHDRILSCVGCAPDKLEHHDEEGRCKNG